MEKKSNDKNFKDTIKDTFNYFEYYIVDNNTISHAPLWGKSIHYYYL